MPKFLVKQRHLCYVDWFYEVEADNEDEAIDKYYSGEHEGNLGFYVGDQSDLYDGDEFIINESDFNFQNRVIPNELFGQQADSL